MQDQIINNPSFRSDQITPDESNPDHLQTVLMHVVSCAGVDSDNQKVSYHIHDDINDHLPKIRRYDPLLGEFHIDTIDHHSGLGSTLLIVFCFAPVLII
jgi:hypothetical protein